MSRKGQRLALAQASAATRRRFDQAAAYHEAGRGAEAFALYEALLATDPRHAPALHYSALLLHQAGRSDEAVARIERSIAADGRVSDTWNNAGLIYRSLGRTGDAANAFERALRLEPTLVEAWVNLSSVRLGTGDPRAAEEAARRAVSLGVSPNASFQLALALAAQRRPAEALEALDASGPESEASVARAGLRSQLLVATGRSDEARAVLDRALAHHDAAELRIERARLADAAADDESAIADYRAALSAGPRLETALSELVFLMKRRAWWDDLAALQSAFRHGVAVHAKRRDASALTPFSFLSDPSSRAEQRAAAEAWSRRYPLPGPVTARPLSDGRLKLGYLSADFHEHATGVLTVGLFEQHDRQRFEVSAYSTGPDDGSPLRRRLVASFDRFVDARGWTDGRIAAAIHDDGIDILVDLKGHTERATGVMALRPAPIAVSYLGYPGTMGAPFIDYLIGDAVVTPLAHAADYAETLVLLPNCYQVNDDRREIADAPARATLGLPDDATVLCCFNNAYKITPDVFDAWCEILRGAPRSVLWLLTRREDDALRGRLRREVASRGVDADRLVFGDTRPHDEYLALYRRADLFIDTWPYNAHTTASDALWSGCPVLTTLGETFAGRVAASLLTAVDFTDGIAASRADYVATATAWASDKSRLAAMRRRLEATVRSSSLFDTRATTRALEAAYLEMAAQVGKGQRAAIVLPA